MKLAITRQVSRSIADCELTYLARETIDLPRARAQHSAYEAALRDLGLAVLSLPEEPSLPDAVFVEDTALVLDECAIILRPGANSRRPETKSVAQVLGRFRSLRRIQPPAQVDGGDVLCLDRRVYVGLSQRSNSHAAAQLHDLLAPLGYTVHAIPVAGCLHLKSAATQIGPDSVLINPAWIDPDCFHGVRSIAIDPSEPRAANSLLVGETVLFGADFPRTRRLLDRAGIPTKELRVDELAKAEGALTCCSLIFSL